MTVEAEQKFDDEVIVTIGFVSMSRGGVDRTRWRFDEDGFPLAMNAALLQAKQELQERIRTLNDDILTMGSPSDYDVTFNGVPIDKVRFER